MKIKSECGSKFFTLHSSFFTFFSYLCKRKWTNIMNENFAIQLFEGKKVRIVWDAEQEKYYFAIADIVQVLTDTVNPRDYIKKMLRRDPELKSRWGTICPPTRMMAADGKRRKAQVADLEASNDGTPFGTFRGISRACFRLP